MLVAIERCLTVKGTLNGKVASMFPGPFPHFFVQHKQELVFIRGCVSGAMAEGNLGEEGFREFRAERFYLKTEICY